jgi:hypothetical protein
VQDLVGAFGKYCFKLRQFCNQVGDSVAIYKLGVPKSHRAVIKFIPHELRVYADLFEKFGFVKKKREGMVICFAKELHLTCSRKSAEAFEHIRSELADLLDKSAGQTISYFKFTLKFIYQVQQNFVRAQITLLGYFIDDFSVEVVVEVAI